MASFKIIGVALGLIVTILLGFALSPVVNYMAQKTINGHMQDAAKKSF